MDDDLYFEEEERPRDTSIDVAKEYQLENVFSTNPDAVFYPGSLHICPPIELDEGLSPCKTICVKREGVFNHVLQFI